MKKNQTVIGSYRTESEAVHVIKRLLSENYLKDEITIFTNSEVAEDLSNPEKVDVAEPDLNGNDEDGKNEHSFWQSLKDAFTVRDHDYYSDPNYTTEDDLLHNYRDDLERGNIIVVVTNFHGDKSDKDEPSQSDQLLNKQTPEETQDSSDPLGTIAGFPKQGGVHGKDIEEDPFDPESSERNEL